ncbi:MAG: ShlB/FhaC/HecB family hemolysin secretion/activation protein [Hydrococcus sp. Prado102]|nr:ShlB/FhaC/HecB family hemolysin secretion/activation protein [Hydrococcus sp. Prado102]
MVSQSLRFLVFFCLQLVGIVLLESAKIRPLQAQTFNPSFPIPPTPTPPEQETPQPLPPLEELLKPVEPTPTPEEEFPGTAPGQVTVKQFKFVGSTVFSQEELAEVTKPFTNRQISFSELLQARSAVTKLYVDNGYVTSGAYIPPQTIENGVVTIEIVEGSLEDINVEVEGRLQPFYVRDRISIATDKPLNVPRLLEALQLLQLDPLIEKISAELSAGTRPGTSVLDVTAEASDTFSAQAFMDNGRVPEVGSFRRGVEFAEASLFGLGDNIRGAYRNTDGSDDFEVDYTVPVNARNGTIKVGYRRVYSQIISPSIFEPLNIDSDYERYGITYRQPIIQTPNQELALGITFDRQNSKTVFNAFGGQPLVVSGTNNQGETRVSSLRLFQEWTQRSEREVIAARSEFNIGLDIFDPTSSFDEDINSQAPDTRYFAWRGQAQWVRLLAPDLLLVARTDLQLSDRPLVSLEQFAIGGLGSVEGYRQNQVLTDNGIFAGVEVRLPVIRSSEPGGSLLQVIPFVNVGTGWNNGGVQNPDPSTLVSVGLGLQFQQGDIFSARLDWGIPLIDANNNGDTWQEDGIHFSVILSPF